MNYPILNNADFDKVSSSLNKIDFNMVLVHPDVLKAFKFSSIYSRQQLLEAHWYAIKKLVNDRPVFMPAFNYDFPKTKYFDVENTTSQVGALPEYFRTNIASWRSSIPMFSYCGEIEAPDFLNREIIDPFDNHSLFNFLVENNGLVMHYGADIVYSTIIHYAERISGNLTYRYDKFFDGKVKDRKSDERTVTLKCHVRPKNHALIYNFKVIEDEMKATHGLVCFKGERFDLRYMKASNYAAYLVSKMQQDSLALLSEETKQWVIPKLQKLGRAFELADFE